MHTAMGRYGIDWDKGVDNLTDAEWATVLAETTKNIEANEDMEEVAFSLIDRGIFYKRKGDYDIAIAEYTAAIQIMPDLAEPFFNRGLAYRKKKQYDDALSDFNKALHLLPGRSKCAEEKIQAVKSLIEKTIQEK